MGFYCSTTIALAPVIFTDFSDIAYLFYINTYNLIIFSFLHDVLTIDLSRKEVHFILALIHCILALSIEKMLFSIFTLLT